MPPAPTQPEPARTRRKDTVQPLRRKRAAVPPPTAKNWRKALDYLLLFITVVLIVDALVGDKGLMDTMRARERSVRLQADVWRLRNDNDALRDRARQLDKDPSAVEFLAREELGLIRPGEMLFILKDAPPRQEERSVLARP